MNRKKSTKKAPAKPAKATVKKSPTKSPAKKIILRELTRAEIPGIFPLVHLHNPGITQALFAKRLKDMLPFGYRALAAFDGARMVAVSGFWLHSRFWCGRHLDIDNFFVHPDYRANGLGKKLVAWLEARALAEKCDLIVLDMYTSNHLAQRFYHREGFVATGYHMTKIPGTTVPWSKG